MTLAPLLPTPNEWLAQIISERKLRYARLARLLGMDKSRFRRWIRGEEQIPRSALALLAQQLPPSDLSYLLRLKDCEDLTDSLGRQANRLFTNLGIGTAPVDDLFQCIRDILTQEHFPTSALSANTAAQYLTDAAAAVQLVQHMVNKGYHRQPLLPPESVPRFRYPINHFIGVLLELDRFIPAYAKEASAVTDFREQVLTNLRRTVWAKPGPSAMEVLAQQFSTHLLARHGTADDREEIEARLERAAVSTDPLLRRLSFTGLALGQRDPDIGSRFRRTLERDCSLSRANLFFNAFHYGDLTLYPHAPLPTDPHSFERSIPHVVRHLEQAERYASILETEILTLVQILDTAGSEPLTWQPTSSRLRGLLGENSSLLGQLEERQRSQFRRLFSSFLCTAG